MKKIILITAGMFAVLAGYSQTNKGNNAGNTGIVADKKSEMGNPVKVVEVKPALISKEEQQNAPVPARLTLSKNSTTSNSKGTTPVEKKVTPVNRTTEEAVGNNGTAAAVDASKTKVEPAKTAEVSKSAIPADIKLAIAENRIKHLQLLFKQILRRPSWPSFLF